MAVTFVSAASTAATLGSAVNAASVTVTAPAGIVTGNLLVAFIHEASAQVFSPTLPSGWTQAALFTPGSPANGGTILVAYKYATGSEPANYTFTMTQTSGNQFQQTPGGVIIQYSGTAASSPIDASGATRSASSSSAVAPSVTTTAANDLLLCAFGVANNTGISTRPAGMTSRSYITGPSNSGNFDVCDVTVAGIGATPTKTESLASGDANIAASVAVFSDGVAPAGAVHRAPAVQVHSRAVLRAAVI